MANYAYVMNSPEFEHLWFNYKQSIGQGQNEFFGNSGPVDGPGGNFTAEDYQNIYQAFMNRYRIRLGISTIGGGLGGGDVLGVPVPHSLHQEQQDVVSPGVTVKEF